MEVNVDFNGLERSVNFQNDYQNFISDIKNIYNLQDDECSRLSFIFVFSSQEGHGSFELLVSNENEFINAKEIGSDSYDIKIMMKLNPKPQNSKNKNNQYKNSNNQGFKNQNNKNQFNYDQYNQNQFFQNQNNKNKYNSNQDYQKHYNNNQNNNNLYNRKQIHGIGNQNKYQNFQNNQNNEEDLDKEIKRLEIEKNNLKKKIEKIRKENQEFEEKKNKNLADSKIDDALNRLKIMEKSESKNMPIISNNNVKLGEIPEKIKIKNINSNTLNCEFLDNKIPFNHTIEVEKSKIKPQNPIIYFFRIKNNGEEVWPDDTLLKCEVDDSEIYFYYVSIKDEDTEFIVLKNGDNYQQFKIRVLFKNYNNIIEGEEYKLRAYLLSDKNGRIGNDYGLLTIKVKHKKENFKNFFQEDY